MEKLVSYGKKKIILTSFFSERNVIFAAYTKFEHFEKILFYFL